MHRLLNEARELLRDVWMPNEEDMLRARVLLARLDAALDEPLEFHAAGLPHECATCALVNPACYAMVGICFGEKWVSRYSASSPLPVAQGCTAGGVATKGGVS